MKLGKEIILKILSLTFIILNFSFISQTSIAISKNPAIQHKYNNIGTGPQIVTGYYQKYSVNIPIAFYSTDGGNSWSNSFFAPMPSSNLNSLACDKSQTKCTVIGTYQDHQYGNLPLSYYTSDGAKTWQLSVSFPPPPSSLVFKDNQLTGIACDNSAQNCTAVGSYKLDRSSNYQRLPYSYYTQNGGITWNASATTPPVTQSNVDFSILGVACDSNAQNCTAVGNYKLYSGDHKLVFYYSTDGGKKWTVSNSFSPQPSSDAVMNGVTCNDSAQNCVAVGSYGSSGSNLALLAYYSSDGGQNWAMSASFPALPSSQHGTLHAVACDSTGLRCIAAGDLNSQGINTGCYYTMNGGKDWTASSAMPLPKPATTVSVSLNSITCDYAAKTCIAAGGYQADGKANLPISYFTNDGGKSWTILATSTPIGNSSWFTSIT